jgi:hypothetical protein
MLQNVQAGLNVAHPDPHNFTISLCYYNERAIESE